MSTQLPRRARALTPKQASGTAITVATPWQWPVSDPFAASGSPGRPADLPVVAAGKERRRQLKRGRKHRSLAPKMPRVRSSAPSSQAPGEPEVTAFS